MITAGAEFVRASAAFSESPPSNSKKTSPHHLNAAPCSGSTS